MSGTEGAGSSDASELRWLMTAFAINVVVFAVAVLLIQLDPLQQQANRGYFDSPASELGPVSRPFLPISTLDEAIEIANGRLPVIVGEAFVPFDRGNEYFWGELIWDHDMGNIYYWELNQDDLSVSILATTGEVVDFSWSKESGNGTLTRDQALAISQRYIEFFGGLPDDASSPSIEYIYFGSTYSMTGYGENGEGNYTDNYDWVINYDRVKDGLMTDDHLMVTLDSNGRYDSYTKVWNMRLGGVTAGHEVTYEEVRDIARSVAEGANITSIEHRIVRPNHAWRDAPWRFGTDPVAVWRVMFEYDEVYYLHYIDIDDLTGEIVGWDGYF